PRSRYSRPLAPRVRGRASSPSSGARRSSATGRRLRGRLPLVPDVGRLLLVPLAVGELDRDRAVRLVEAALALVVLEDPDLEAVRPHRLRMLEETVADSGADLVGVDVEVREPVVVEDREAAAEDVPLAVADTAAEEAQVLLVRVQPREEVEQREGRLEDRD